MTKNEERINELFKELVPETGKADSLAGELVRAMSRIGYRFYNDGDQLGIGYGKETCNPAGRFLGVKGNDKIAKLTADAWAVYSEEAYEKVLKISGPLSTSRTHEAWAGPRLRLSAGKKKTTQQYKQ